MNLRSPNHIVRLLAPKEWEKIVPLVRKSFPEESKTGMPLPDISTAIVVEDNITGDIKAVMFYQPIYHAEPFCAEKGFATYFPDMVAVLEKHILATNKSNVYYCTAPNNPAQIQREEQLGRIVLQDHVPVVRIIEDI